MNSSMRIVRLTAPIRAMEARLRLQKKLQAQRRSASSTLAVCAGFSAMHRLSPAANQLRYLHTSTAVRKDDLVDEIDIAKQRSMGRISSPENMVKVRRGLMRLAIPFLFISSFWFDSGLITTPLMVSLSGILTYFSWQLTKSSLSINLSSLMDPKRLLALGPVNLLIGALSMFFQVQFYLPFALRMLVLMGQLGAYGYAFYQSDWRNALREMVEETDWKTGLSQLSYDIQTKSRPTVERTIAMGQRLIHRKPYGAEVGYALGWSQSRSNRVPNKLIERSISILQEKAYADLVSAVGDDYRVLSGNTQLYKRFFAKERQGWFLKATGVGHTVHRNYATIEGFYEIAGSKGKAVVEFEAKLNGVLDLKAYSIERDVDFTRLSVDKLSDSHRAEAALAAHGDQDMHQEVDFGERKAYVRASYLFPRNLA